jgi:site-specific recombinase XerD
LKAQQRALEIPIGKTEARVIPLTTEALEHFKACAAGKTPAAWLVSRADGAQWKKEAWRDEIKEAARRAKLPRAIVAYTLRHSVITDLVTGGLDLFTVAKLAGTSVVMIEKHYGHLQREHARSALEKLALA